MQPDLFPNSVRDEALRRLKVLRDEAAQRVADNLSARSCQTNRSRLLIVQEFDRSGRNPHECWVLSILY